MKLVLLALFIFVSSVLSICQTIDLGYSNDFTDKECLKEQSRVPSTITISSCSYPSGLTTELWLQYEPISGNITVDCKGPYGCKNTSSATLFYPASISTKSLKRCVNLYTKRFDDGDCYQEWICPRPNTISLIAPKMEKHLQLTNKQSSNEKEVPQHKNRYNNHKIESSDTCSYVQTGFVNDFTSGNCLSKPSRGASMYDISSCYTMRYHGHVLHQYDDRTGDIDVKCPKCVNDSSTQIYFPSVIHFRSLTGCVNLFTEKSGSESCFQEWICPKPKKYTRIANIAEVTKIDIKRSENLGF